MIAVAHRIVLDLKYRIRVSLLGALQTANWACQQAWCPHWMLRPVMIGALITYRATLSHFVGRDCLFTPSCSQRALRALQTLPLKAAMTEALEQVMGCNPNYSLRSAGEGWILVTSNGRSYHDCDLSHGVGDKLRELRQMQAARVGAGAARG